MIIMHLRSILEGQLTLLSKVSNATNDLFRYKNLCALGMLWVKSYKQWLLLHLGKSFFHAVKRFCLEIAQFPSKYYISEINTHMQPVKMSKKNVQKIGSRQCSMWPSCEKLSRLKTKGNTKIYVVLQRFFSWPLFCSFCLLFFNVKCEFLKTIDL